jgi:hypothetical protein
MLRLDPKISNPCAGMPDSTLPDLSIVQIERFEFEAPASLGNNYPRATNLKITIQNMGKGIFDGSILCNYGTLEEHHASGRPPEHADPFTIVLHPGDTTIVGVTVSRWFAHNTHLRCELRTDSFPLHTFDPMYHFGREPVCEVSYENNIAEYLMD